MVKSIVVVLLCFSVFLSVGSTDAYLSPIDSKGLVETTNQKTIFISQTSPPVIERVSPLEAFQGTELLVIITGKGFVSKSLVSFSPLQGIEILLLTFVSSSELRINVRISSTAPIGARDVIVFNPDQSSSTLKGGFTIKATPTPGSIKLTPEKAENPLNTNHRVVATVIDTANRLMVGVKVTFTVTGANVASGTATTDANGQASFTYQGTKAGEDKITATVDKLSAIAIKIWLIKESKEIEEFKFIQEPKVTQINQEEVIISWSTNKKSVGKIFYRSASGNYSKINGEEIELVAEKIERGVKVKINETYQFYVEASDMEGNVIKSRVYSFRTLPPISVKKPEGKLKVAQFLSGISQVKFEVVDYENIEKVSFYFDKELKYTDYSFPYSWDFDTRGLTEGMYPIMARVFDKSGGYSDVIEERQVRHRFEERLSPVKVRIIQPLGGFETYNNFTIIGEVRHEYGGRISYVEFVLNETIVKVNNYDPAINISPFEVSHLLDISGVRVGTHVINLRARDESGNWGSASLRFKKITRPTPSIEVSREVRRINNYFEVILNLTNTTPGILNNLNLTEKSSGYQYLPIVYLKVGSGSYNPISVSVTNSEHVNHQVDLQIPLGTFRQGENMSLKYYLIPILYYSSPSFINPKIGVELKAEFQFLDRENHLHFNLEWNDLGERNRALRSADYLIVTNPSELLFRYGGDGLSSVNNLLSIMAELAREKQGVLGYIPRAGSTSEQLREKIRRSGEWGSKMFSGWGLTGGYLLIVGENQIVPAFNIQIDGDEFPLIDYLYANIEGDDLPELRVGRIIGNDPEELLKPLRASLDVLSGIASYDGSDLLLVSGPEAFHYEGIILNAEGAKNNLISEGVNYRLIHTEYMTNRRTILEEALKIKGSTRGGANDRANLSTFTVPQLQAWLLQIEGRLIVPRGATVTTFTDSEGINRRLPDPMLLENINEAFRIAERLQVSPRGGNFGTYSYHPEDAPISPPPRHQGWDYERERSNRIKNEVLEKDLIIFTGHGDPGGWGGVLTDWIDSGSEIDPISFGRNKPVVIAFACSTGFYRLFDGGRSISIAKAFLRNGASIYIGAIKNTGATHCDEMVNEGWWQYWSKDDRMGDVFYNFQRDRIGREGFYRFVHEYNLYGDPKFGRR